MLQVSYLAVKLLRFPRCSISLDRLAIRIFVVPARLISTASIDFDRRELVLDATRERIMSLEDDALKNFEIASGTKGPSSSHVDAKTRIAATCSREQGCLR